MRIAAVAALLSLVCHPAFANGENEPVSLAAFSDGIKHWQDRHGKDYARLEPRQVTEIADNLLLYQRDNGGWIENRDPARILDASEKAALAAEKGQAGASFDNRNIYSQIEYLSAAFTRTKRPPIATPPRAGSISRCRSRSPAAAAGRTLCRARRVITARSPSPTK